MSNLVNRHWINFDGEPVTGRTPPSILVYGPPMTPQQFGEVAHTYKLFTDANLVAVGDYQVRNRVLRDGTRVRCLSINGVDTVYVWTSGGGEMLYYFFYPRPTVPVWPFPNSGFSGDPDLARRYQKRYNADDEPLLQVAYRKQECTRVRKTDGVLVLFVGDTNGTDPYPSDFGFVTQDTRSEVASLNTNVLLVGDPAGTRTCAYLPLLLDESTGIGYLGTYLHGKVRDSESTVTIENGTSVAFPSVVRVDNPNTQLVALENLPPPPQAETTVVGPVSLLNKAILYGGERNYDALTGMRFGRFAFPYVPPTEGSELGNAKSEKTDVYFTVELSHTQRTDVIPIYGTIPIFVSVRIERATVGKPQEALVIQENFSFPCTVNQSRYITTSIFSPNGRKFCVLVHHYAAASALDADPLDLEGKNDPRRLEQPMYAIEGVLSGGSAETFPECVFSLVEGLPEYRAPEYTEAFDYEGYEYVHRAGISFPTSYGTPLLDSSETTYVDEDGNVSFTREETYGAAAPTRYESSSYFRVSEKPVLVAYGLDNELKITTIFMEEHHFATPGSAHVPTSNLQVNISLFRAAGSDEVEIIQGHPEPSYSYTNQYEAGATIRFELRINGAVVESGTAATHSVTLTESETGVWKAFPFGHVVGQGFDVTYFIETGFGNYSVIAPSGSTGTQVLSNNVVVVGIAASESSSQAPSSVSSGPFQRYYIVTPNGINQTAGTNPSPQTPGWGAWNPITDEITFEENTSWC